MNIDITNEPSLEDNNILSKGLQSYNSKFSCGTVEQLAVYVRVEKQIIIGGLTGVTFGGWLHVDRLWVSEDQRGKSIGTKILVAAEQEAIRRGCVNSTLDTYSFQALDFYLRQGYSEFGLLKGYAGHFDRHYLQKRLIK